MLHAQTKTSRRLRGVIAAIPTPVEDTGADHSRLVNLARTLLDAGCHGLNLLGTTGEATSFSVEQRTAAMSAVAQAGLPLERIMVGTGAAALADAIALSRHAAALGFAGILLLPPFYYKQVTDAGLLAYVHHVVEATAGQPVPIYLYNFPALSGVPYSLPLVAELLRRFGPRIAGLKDSSGDLFYAKSAASLSDTLAVFPSSEAHLPMAGSNPFAGCISGTANIGFRDCVEAFDHTDEAALARAIAVQNVFEGLPSIPAIKHLLSRIHQDPSLARVMPPLDPLTPAEADRLLARFYSLTR